MVFWTTSLIYVIGFVVYILFADVTIQPWALKNNNANNDNDKINQSTQEESKPLKSTQLNDEHEREENV